MALPYRNLDHAAGMYEAAAGPKLPMGDPAPNYQRPASEPTGSVSEVDEDFRRTRQPFPHCR